MNKKELVQAAAAKSGLSQADTAKALNGILDAISESLAEEQAVQLIGFGTFSVKQRAARKGFNPMTKQPITIAASKVVHFKASKAKK